MKNLVFNFKDRHAVVTGGGQGIGFEITKMFLTAGARVTIWDYSQAALDVARKELASFGDRLNLQVVNVADWSSCQTAAAALATPVHVLVNNAGITRDKSLAKMDHTEFDAVIQTNLNGIFHVTKSLLEKFGMEPGNRIVNMASVVALYGNFGQSNYVAAKAGVIGMTKTWARELGKKGFTVNAVAPGFTRTAINHVGWAHQTIDRADAKRALPHAHGVVGQVALHSTLVLAQVRHDLLALGRAETANLHTGLQRNLEDR